MCLTPHRSFHPSKKEKIRTRYGTYNNRLEVLTLTRPIIVFKGLRAYKSWRGNMFRVTTLTSPYKGTQYSFGQTKTANGMAKCIAECDSISVGLHALRTKKNFRTYFNTFGLNTIDDRSNFTYRNGEIYAFPAVIPAGAKVWIGDNGDIVATELTVYEDLKSIHEVYGSIADHITTKAAVGLS